MALIWSAHDHAATAALKHPDGAASRAGPRTYRPLARAARNGPLRFIRVEFRAPPTSPGRRSKPARTARADRRRWAACGPGHRRANLAAWPPATRTTHRTAAIRSARG